MKAFLPSALSPGQNFHILNLDKKNSEIFPAYELQIRQNSDYSSYKLKIGMQKETVDISDYDIISDSVTFTDQRNVYTFTPDESGITYEIQVWQDSSIGSYNLNIEKE